MTDIKKIIHIADVHIPNVEEDKPYSQMIENFIFECCKVCADYNKVNEFIRFSEDSAYIVIMTHAHEYDEFVLKKIINEKYKYLGMIGSERKVNIVKQRMLSEGFSREKIDKLFSPVGLEIGSHTPVEIAISIMAQIISIRYGKLNI